MTAIRRSGRTRRQAQTFYDDAKKAQEEQESETPVKSRDDDDDTDDSSKEAPEDNETEAESPNEDEQEDEPSSEESSDDEDAFEPKRVRKSSPRKKFKPPAKKRIALEVAPRKKTSTTTTRSTARTAPTRGVQTALSSLARKVLEDGETPENSLAAALLLSSKSKRASSKTGQRSLNEEKRTIFTPQLEETARSVVEKHKDDPNAAQTVLMNLIFRSVGGSVETNIDPDEVTLEDMDSEQWGKIVTDLVDEMRHTPADRVLLCADPDGAVHAAAVDSSRDPSKVTVAPSSLGVREYRKIYEEFWYVLGRVALSEGVSSVQSLGDEESSDGERQRSKSFASTSRFDVEMTKDMTMRILELVSVGQPDVRAAATLAALHMGHALLDQTVLLGTKIDIAMRQFSAATGGKKELSRKAQSLKHQMDSLKRTRADLEEVVLGPILQGVFMHRYRDSNMHIRAACIAALSRMTLQRPDLFLMDKYLKYFGWMMNDKCACVRVASVSGLLAPFKAVQEKNESKKSSTGPKIDLSLMQSVSSRFLNRFVECLKDVSVPVQENAMALLLSLLRNGFLDDEVHEDEEQEAEFWNKINSRAISRDTSRSVRRDALYFVLEQLEAFDSDEDQEMSSDRDSRWSKDKRASLAQSSERVDGRRLVELADWVAHILPYTVDRDEDIDVEVAKYVVYALREMPEHRHLATNWSAMLKAICDDDFAPSGHSNGDGALRQRVQVQMLACAAETEVATIADPEFLLTDVDADVVAALTASDIDKSDRTKTKKNRTNSAASSEGMEHEILSVALLRSLPELLLKFKGDSTVLGSITKLPRYLLPSVFGLPQRKKDVMALMKNLTDIFLESADESVLHNSALSLNYLAAGDHARAPDGRVHLRRIATTLQDRLVTIFGNASDHEVAGGKKRKSKAKQSPSKRRRSERSSVSSQSSVNTVSPDEQDVSSDATDSEYAIYLCLKRMRVLSKRCDVGRLLESPDDSPDDGIEFLCNTIVENIVHRLNDRKVILSEAEGDGDDTKVGVPDIWQQCSEKVHSAVAKSVVEALSLLLSITSWKLTEAQEQEGLLVNGKENTGEDSDMDEEMEDHVVLRLRDQLVAVVELCFEQFLPDPEEDGDDQSTTQYTAAHVAFADVVQIHAGNVASDLRTLFPKEWANAANSFLRSCALVKDGRLIGGFVRYFRSNEEKLRTNEHQDQDGTDLVQSLLLPMGRSLGPNWSQGNRREAGVILAHVTGSGAAASDLVSSLSRLLKKVQPVRVLESHMACLRQSYDDWVENRPEELESDRPTDEEMAMYDEEERKHEQHFHALEQQAARLSMSLGVGKLSDAKLTTPLLGFVREGIRFAFSKTATGAMDEEEDEELMLGCRLTFLPIISRYVNWIKKNKEHYATIRDYFEAREEELRAREDFDEVHEDDLEALAAFRTSLGLKDLKKKEFSPRSAMSVDDRNEEDFGGDDELSTAPSSADMPSRPRPRLSRGSSVGSMRSKLSTRSSLSPLYEEDDREDSSPSPKKRRLKGYREPSIGSTIESIGGRTQTPIEEESDEGSEGSLS